MSKRAPHALWLEQRSVRTPLHSRTRRLTVSAILCFVFLGCNFSGTNAPEEVRNDVNEDRFHEKSFSWNAPETTPDLSKTSARTTRFETQESLGEAIRKMDGFLHDPSFSENLWKPLDHTCDGLLLALWNTYGTITLGDSIVLDEKILKSHCTDIRENDSPTSSAAEKPSATQGTNASYPARNAEHRVYPYKMTGRSWDNFDMVVYKSTGAETQFKKYRERFFTMAWWDTKASRIGVRTYFLNCGFGSSGSQTVRMCLSAGDKSDWSRDADYISQKDFSAGLQVIYSPPNGSTTAPKNLRVSDAVIARHSADHAGIAFRATSSSGLTSATLLVAMPPLEYAVW